MMRNFKYAVVLLAALPCLTMCNTGEKKVHGVDLANLDTSVAPGEDFYNYACGGWMKANPIGDQYSRYGTFDALGENNLEQLKDLFAELSNSKQEQGSVGQKVRDLYVMGMDSTRLNEEGATPMAEDLKKIAEMNRADLSKMIGSMHASIGSPFFGSGVESDLMNSDFNTLYITQPGLGLPDRDYYIVDSEENKSIIADYVKYLEKIFTLSGYTPENAIIAAQNVLNLETAFAKANMSREELRDYSKQYNPRTRAELKKQFANIDWDIFFTEINLPDADTVIVMQTDALGAINKMLPQLSDEAIKDYLTYNYIQNASGYLSDDFRNANFELFGKKLQGKKEQQPRWKQALGVPNSLLGEAVGELYVNKYFAHGSKERMLELVGNLQESLGEHIQNLTWMSDSTKANALKKLSKFKVKIGYPDNWRDYSNIDIDPSKSYWENVKTAIIAEGARNYAKYGKEVDKEEWLMSPQTVNAYYNPSTNEICFPAGILQPPFFDVMADDASNYGAIGVVIGHEMTHGFDDQGRNFDEDGNMRDWWSADDAARFTALTDILVAQFDSIKVLGDTHANGKFTLGENIADHGGLRVSYTAFKKTPQGKSTELIDGLTPDQRFYLGYAGVWAGNIRDEEILRRTKTDPHSLGRWRVNATLRNLEPFFTAFDIKEGDAMWLAPENRVTIW